MTTAFIKNEKARVELAKQFRDAPSSADVRRISRREAWYALGSCIFALLLIGVGIACNSKGNPITGENPALPPIAASDTSIGKAEADVTGIRDAGVKLEPHVAQPGIPLLAWMRDAATRALENLATAKSENANAKAAVIASEKARDVETRRFVAQIESRDREIARVKNTWGYWIEFTIVRPLITLIVILACLGLAFRVAAFFVGGWTGTTLAKVGSVLLNLFPFGGFLNEFFTNAYFRDRAAKLNPQ